MMEGGSRSVRWKDDEVKNMENLDQFVMETAPQVLAFFIILLEGHQTYSVYLATI